MATKKNDRNDIHDANSQNESPRQLARRQRRQAGDRSASAAQALLQLPKAMLDSLGLSDELREAVDRARAIISHGAIRREERYLAGLLRQIDIDDLEKRLATLQKAGQAEAHHFHQAETWRKRLIEEGEPALEAFVKRFAGADPSALLTRVAEAQREKATGSPRGAARALFRQVMAAMHPNIGPDQGPMAKRKLGD